ncbi:uncharacterized protein LOC133862536 [Alnus glutinosa]|uniref:uncharacterized protein LOC133862536 n=1 Tax=Alnus glutinosa TaxID=3517 RepID=UPI002D79C7D0|nr:uncharacterized protein LOC133862536 [Alnus glutinosa]
MLFQELLFVKGLASQIPWLVTGDFNVVRAYQEKSGKEGFSNYEHEFIDCLSCLEIEDRSSCAWLFPYVDKQSMWISISKKLDRALSNLEWLQHFGNTAVECLERGVSDHSLILFLDWIAEGWSINVEGYSMFRLYSKLKTVKRILKVKNLEVFGGLGQRVSQVRQELAAAQAAFLSSHGDATWLQKERECLHVLISITAAEENFFKQKPRNNWLNLGDGNTVFFHKNLLGHTSHEFTHVKADKVANLFCKKFSPCVERMQARVTKDEIQQVILSMDRTKAPGPEGLLKEVNSTIITLVPKKKNATSVGYFRPISCCNLVYKCITKILANRLVAGVDEVISSNQGAFVPKRSIVENILLTQELVSNYHRTMGKARCTLKIDLMKAYDSLNWDYVFHCLGCLGARSKLLPRLFFQ